MTQPGIKLRTFGLPCQWSNPELSDHTAGWTYTELRLNYFTSIPEYNLLLNNNNLDLCVTVSDKDKLNTIMNSVNKETIISVANFIFDMNILRKNICNVD